MLSILLVSKTGGTYENEKIKAVALVLIMILCGAAFARNAGGSEGECSAGKVIW